MKKTITILLIGLLADFVCQAQTYSYVIEDWNFTNGSLNSEEGTGAGFFGNGSSDDGTDQQFFVDRGDGNSGAVAITEMTAGKIHVFVTLSDYDFSFSDDQYFTIKLRDGGSNIAEVRFDAHVAGGVDNIRLAGTSATASNAGLLVEGNVSSVGMVYGFTLDFDGGTMGTGAYTYWQNTPDDDGSGWKNRFANNYTGDIDLSGIGIDEISWGINGNVAGDYFNLDQIRIINETTIAPPSVAYVSATKDDHVVINSDIATTENKRLYSMTVEAGSTFTVDNNDELTIYGDLVINGDLIVNSTGSLITFGSVTGVATVKRSTTYGNTDGKYSIVGSSVTGADTDALGDFTYKYDETIAYGSGAQERFSLVSSAETMAPGDGYFSANLGTASFVGTPNTGEITQPLVYDETNDGGSVNAGWNLVANPYPASIELVSFLSANADITGAVYLWDDGGSNLAQRTNSDYITVNALGATGGSGRSTDWDGYIRSEQGFFVKSTAPGTLKFTDVMKTTGKNSGSGYFRTNEVLSKLRISLSNESFTSETLIAMHSRATNGFDRSYDAPKLKSNPNVQLYSILNETGQELAIQGIPTDNYEEEIWLGIDLAEPGTYSLKFTNGIPIDHIQLVDHELDEVIDLHEQGSYTFHSGTASGQKRFSLQLIPVVSGHKEELKQLSYFAFLSDGQLTIRSERAFENVAIHIHDIHGRKVLEEANITSGNGKWVTEFNYNPGIYIINILRKDKYHSLKILK